MHVPGLHGGGVKIIRRKPCEVCGRYMTSRLGLEGKNWKKQKRCSPECYYESLRGGKLTEETKRKIGAASKGNTYRKGKPGLKGSKGSKWRGDEVGYAGAHTRLRLARGNASEHKCTCGRQAHHWAFRWDRAEHVLTDARGQQYSLNPDDYEPMCGSCHHWFDREGRAVA